VTVTADQGATVWFGNVALPGLRILKFRDDNGNGIHDSGEPGLNGWSFSLARFENNEWRSSGSGLTANGGLLGFSDLPFPFTYRAQETNVPSGWYWSTPVSQELLINQNTVYSMTFGNLQLGELEVTKQWYLNGETTDAPEQPAQVCVKRTGPGTPYQTIAPTNSSGTPLTADSNGYYCQDLSTGVTIKRLWPGVYAVTETSPAGWTGRTGRCRDAHCATAIYPRPRWLAISPRSSDRADSAGATTCSAARWRRSTGSGRTT
jgi:hypothetical protein